MGRFYNTTSFLAPLSEAYIWEPLFLAGIGAIETYIEKVSRKYDFEYGKSRMWGSLGWAAVAFFAGRLFNINPNINFWIASVSAVILTAIIMSVKIEMTDHEKNRADSVRLKDVGRLFFTKRFLVFYDVHYRGDLHLRRI